jgi:hypothetical protein
MVLLSLIPQVHFWFVRGRDWNGAYATIQGDEYLYSGYLNALIDGRPRRNDPFSGSDSTAQSPLPESTFSIQFIPGQVISILARALHANASTAFIVLAAAAGLLASLSVFWLLASVMGDNKLAAVGVLVVLCCGALAGGEGLVGVLLNHTRSFFLPFLRRYQPAAVFPLFFVFCTLIWRALTVGSKGRARLESALAGLTIGVLVFSYLYLWTAAIAWLVCLALPWIYLRPTAERRRSLEVFTITTALLSLALIPYAYLVSHRAASLDDAQTMFLTHRPDLFRTPEFIGAFILLLLIIGVRRRKVVLSEPRVVFAASFALLPFVVFNQQLLTGRSMQPFHFESFVANYAVLVSLMIVISLFWKAVPNRALAWIATLCFLWGAMEIGLPTLARSGPEVVNDQMVPVLRRLKESAKYDGTFSSLRDAGKTSTMVFSPHSEVMGMIPTWAPQGTLLALGGLEFGGVSQHQRKELLYLYLYYCEVNGDRLLEFLNQKSNDSLMNYYAPSVIFGHERILPMLGFDFNPIRQDEIEKEVRAYQAYVDSFSRDMALQQPLTYVVTSVEQAQNLSHVDRWYQRDNGEQAGPYVLFRVNLR